MITHHVRDDTEVSWRVSSQLFLALLILWPAYATFNVGFARLGLSQIFGFIFVLLQFFRVLMLPYLANHYTRSVASSPLLVTTILVMIIFRCLSSLFGESPATSQIATIRDVSNIVIALVLGIHLTRCKTAIDASGKTIVIAAVAVSVVGIFEAANYQLIINTLNLSSHLPSMDTSVSSIFVDKFREGRFRAQVIFSHPIVFAQFVGASAPFFLYQIKSSRPISSIFLALSLFLLLFAIFVSGSRSGYIVFATAVGSYFLFRMITAANFRFENFLFLFIALAVVMLLQGFFRDLVIGTTPDEVMSSELRYTQFEQTVGQLYDSPFIGFGAGLATEKAGVISKMGNTDYLTLDNLYLTYALNFGLIGLATFLLVVSGMFLGFIELLRTGFCSTERNIICAMLSCSTSILIGFYVLSIETNAILIYLFVGILIGLRGKIGPRRASHRHRLLMPKLGRNQVRKLSRVADR